MKTDRDQVTDQATDQATDQDREKLIALIKEANLSMWGRSGISSAAERRAYLADYLISKGVTIPVRCKDCKYFYLDDERGLGWCVYCSGNVEVSENGYCYRGERKEE